MATLNRTTTASKIDKTICQWEIWTGQICSKTKISQNGSKCWFNKKFRNKEPSKINQRDLFLSAKLKTFQLDKRVMISNSLETLVLKIKTQINYNYNQIKRMKTPRLHKCLLWTKLLQLMRKQLVRKFKRKRKEVWKDFLIKRRPRLRIQYNNLFNQQLQLQLLRKITVMRWKIHQLKDHHL